jgi:surface antigen
LAVASALALTSVSVAPVAEAQQTHLSKCMGNGLLGAGVGGLIGAFAFGRHHRLAHAAEGAAVGGVGTWAVCKLLSHHDQEHVESAYQQSLETNQPYNSSWNNDQGAPRTVYVSQPQDNPNAGDRCRSVNATISDPQNGNQQLPPEVFCRNDDGQWVPQSN